MHNSLTLLVHCSSSNSRRALDIIVHPYLHAQSANAPLEPILERINALLPRLHVLVIGPGLSRDPLLQKTAAHVLLAAKSHGMPIVLDADGLFLLLNQPELIHGYTDAILTPNKVEFERLCTSQNTPLAVDKLAASFGGVTIVQKGKVDLISNGVQTWSCDTPASPKRQGGQGYILAGTLATFCAWGRHSPNSLAACAFASCSIVRDTSLRTFNLLGRSMQTSDMLMHLGTSFSSFEKAHF